MLYQLSYVGRILLERVMGIEPTPSAWKAEVLPLNYTRSSIDDLDSPLTRQALNVLNAPLLSTNADADRKPGGGGRIRTYEGMSQQIYSLPPLAAWVSLRLATTGTLRNSPRF